MRFYWKLCNASAVILELSYGSLSKHSTRITNSCSDSRKAKAQKPLYCGQQKCKEMPTAAFLPSTSKRRTIQCLGSCSRTECQNSLPKTSAQCARPSSPLIGYVLFEIPEKTGSSWIEEYRTVHIWVQVYSTCSSTISWRKLGPYWMNTLISSSIVCRWCHSSFEVPDCSPKTAWNGNNMGCGERNDLEDQERKQQSTGKRREECPHLCTCREAPLSGPRSHLPRYLSRAIWNHGHQHDQTDKKCQGNGPSTETAGSICQRKGDTNLNGPYPTRWEYAIHLSPWTNSIREAIGEVEKSFFFQVFGGIPHRKMEWLRMLCRIHTPKHRRVILEFRMLQRERSRKEAILQRQNFERNFDELEWVSRDIAVMLRREKFQLPLQYTRESLSEGAPNTKLFIEEASRLEKRRKRQLPYEEPKNVTEILNLRQLKHRQLVAQYASGRFPQASISLMVDGFGPRVHEHLAKLQDNLSKYYWSPEEILKTERALKCLLLYPSAIIDSV